MKKCMPYNEGDSPFGTYNYPNSEQSLFDFSYKCPSFVANCSSDDKCGDTQDHCCNLKSIDPNINGDIRMCMANPGVITGFWQNYDQNDNQLKMNYSFSCPANVI